MSRKREGLVELLHWSRRPSTCEQAIPRRERDERPNTGTGQGSANTGSSGRGLSSHANSIRGGLPPLSRSGLLAYGGTGTGGNGSATPEPPESISHFQEALYVNGQPHNATSRLLRLGAGGSPMRRSITAAPSPPTPAGGGNGALMPPLPPPLPCRTQSASIHSASGLAAPCPDASASNPSSPFSGAGSLILPVPTLSEASSFRQQPQLSQVSQMLHLGSTGGSTSFRPSTAWTAAGMPPAGSPPRSIQRFGSRESNSTLLEEARRKAQEAMEVLCGDQEISPETRAQATSALQELEAVLGPREMNMTALLTAARSLRSDLCKELHSSDKQSGFAHTQLKALERQHDRLRHQLRTRPDPIALPPPSGGVIVPVAVAGLSDTGTPSISPKGYHHGSSFDLLTLNSYAKGTGSFSAPQSPMPHARSRLDSSPPLPPRPGYYAAAVAAATAVDSGGVGGTAADAAEGGGSSGSSVGGCGPAVSAAATASTGTTTTTNDTAVPFRSTMSFADRDASGGGGVDSAGGGGAVVLSDKWSLAGAMERTLQIRAISRVEAALQAVAAEHAAAERRPTSVGAVEVVAPVDVEELRQLKHAPQGLEDMLPDTPSYLGVNVRRAPSPGSGLGASEARLSGALRPSAAGRLSAGPGGSSGAAADTRFTLQWSNRGISTAKMPLLREALAQGPQLVRLCLAGNKLSNEDVTELMSFLSEPSAPRIRELLLDQNTNLTWRCALPLALALGMSPDMAASAAAADWAAVAAALATAAPAASAGGAGGGAAAAAAAAAAFPGVPTPASVLAPVSVPSARDKIQRLPHLRVLALCGVKLGDKGVAQLAEGLRANNSLRELDLRRCSISDAGGAVLMDVLESNGRLTRLDVSWNALRTESARVLEAALAGNAGLRELSLAHNGFGDLDGARVIKGLLNHGRWLHVDLSHNTLGPGSCMMVGELLRRLGAAAEGLMAGGSYADGWELPGREVGAGGYPGQSGVLSAELGPAVGPLTLGSRGSLMPMTEPLKRANGLFEDRSAPPSPSAISRLSAGQLGSQLQTGQPSLALDGNPLGSTGLRIILDAMEAMSQSMMSTAGLHSLDPSASPEHEQQHLTQHQRQQHHATDPDMMAPGLAEAVPPLPLHIRISGCNVSPPSDRSAGDADESNPFLPSIAVLCRSPAGGTEGKPAVGGGKDGAAAKISPAASTAPASGKPPSGRGGRDRGASSSSSSGAASVPPHAALTLQSPHLDLQSPAGVYSLELGHPGTPILVSYLLRMRERLAAAAEAGLVAAGVAVSICAISVNGRTVKLEQLATSLDSWGEGTLQLTVKAPAVLALEPPEPLTPMVARWLASLLADPTVSPLWKLSVVQAAGSVCFFTPAQCLALLAGFDRDTENTECVAAAQMLYARSAQPLAFWEHVLPRLNASQQQALRERVGDLVALDMTRPMGRYTLNLSRQVDRFVALRLQLASALESSWLENKYYINWLNAHFNGQPLDRPGLTRIRDYTLPGAGVLRLDYVSYTKPGLGLAPAPPEELAELLSRLRGCSLAHINALLKVRAQLAPPPPQPTKRDGMRSPIGRRKQPAPPMPPKPRLSAFQLMNCSLLDVARFLASPGPPPPPPPGVDPATAPPPLLPVPWTRAAGFDPEPLFRRTGVQPPEVATAGYSIPPPPASEVTGPPAMVPGGGAEGGQSVYRGASVSIGGKSAKGVAGRISMASVAAAAAAQAGRASIFSSAPASRGGRRRSRLVDAEAVPGVTQADYHAALLAMVHQAKDLPLLAAKMGAAHLAAAVGVLLRQQDTAPAGGGIGGDDGARSGLRAVAALLAALPPLVASKFLYDQVDPSPCLLPPEQRRALRAVLPVERLRLLEAAARGAAEAALARARQVRTELNQWASRRLVSSEQVISVLRALHTEGDRVAAMMVLWPRLVDGRWKRTYMQLKLSEQRQVFVRLGFWHVYTCLADPHGISFSLDLLEPEQRDIARELVRMAVRETMRAKQEAKARGGLYAATLLDLHGNGNRVSIPEDEKLWGMADSNFRTMDFLYCPTFEQSLERVVGSAVHIQRVWSGVRARRAAKRERELDETEPTVAESRPPQEGGAPTA